MNPVTYLAMRWKPAIEQHLLADMDKNRRWDPLQRFRPPPEQRIPPRHHRWFCAGTTTILVLFIAIAHYAQHKDTGSLPWLYPALLFVASFLLYGMMWLFTSIYVSCWNRRSARLSGDTSHDREFGGVLVFMAISVYSAPFLVGDAVWEWNRMTHAPPSVITVLMGHDWDVYFYVMVAFSLMAFAISLWTVYLFGARRRQTLTWLNALLAVQTLQWLCTVTAFAVEFQSFYGFKDGLHNLVAYIAINVYAVFSTRYQAIFVR